MQACHGDLLVLFCTAHCQHEKFSGGHGAKEPNRPAESCLSVAFLQNQNDLLNQEMGHPVRKWTDRRKKYFVKKCLNLCK